MLLSVEVVITFSCFVNADIELCCITVFEGMILSMCC